MVISNIQLVKDKQSVTLAADIQFRGKKVEHAYIQTSAKNESFIINDASPFLAAVLLPCMKTGENVYVDGSVSSKFLKNTNEIMKLVTKWDIGLSKIDIRAKDSSDAVFVSKSIGSFFTAGVDSFYTYLKHSKAKNGKITHLVLVHGFDIPLSNDVFFKDVAATVEKVAKEEKIKAIILKTNIGEIGEKRLVWDFAHGGALGSIALFLRKGIKHMYVPGAVRNDQLFPYGTHPELDKLWSSETLSISSDGGEHDRIGKITSLVSKSPLALKYLRVCTQNIKGKYNCSRCFKCLMTMFYLAGTDTLKDAKTFDHTIDLEAVRRMYYDYKLKYNIQGEMALEMLHKKKLYPELQEAIEYSLAKSRHPKFMKKIYQAVAKFDQDYNDRRLYRFVFKMNGQQDRNFIFKYLFKKGILK